MLVASAVFAFIAWRRGYPLPQSIASAVFGVVGLLALVAPSAARPLHKAWMGLGHLLGRFTTPIMLTAVFAFVLIPARVFLTLIGRDPLNRKRLAGTSTYWTTRPRKHFDRDDFERLS